MKPLFFSHLVLVTIQRLCLSFSTKVFQFLNKQAKPRNPNGWHVYLLASICVACMLSKGMFIFDCSVASCSSESSTKRNIIFHNTKLIFRACLWFLLILDIFVLLCCLCFFLNVNNWESFINWLQKILTFKTLMNVSNLFWSKFNNQKRLFS